MADDKYRPSKYKPPILSKWELARV
jgi:hypothetical protein